MMPGLGLPMFGSATADNVPDAATWGDLGDGTTSSASNAAVVISGINEPTMFRVESSGNGSASNGNGNVLCLVDGVEKGSVTVRYAAVADFFVSEGEALSFSVTGRGGDAWACDCTISVKFKSPGSSTFDQTLDAFDVNLVEVV